MRLALSKKYETLQLRLQKCMASYIFKDPMKMIQNKYILVDQIIKKLETQIQTKKQSEKEHYITLLSKLDTLSPLKTLTRGYSIAQKKDKIVKSAQDLNIGDKLVLKFIDGNQNVEVI